MTCIRSGLAPAILVLVMFSAGCDERSWERIPGFWLGGEPTPIPENWSTVNQDQVAWLETWSFYPYVVAVGYVGSDSDLYVMAIPDSNWLRRLTENPDEIRMRIGGASYELSAALLDDVDEIAHLLELYNEKYDAWIERYYGFDLTLENLTEHLIPVRLDARG